MSETPNHPIDLDAVVFTKCHVEALSKHVPPQGGTMAPPVQNEINVHQLDGEPRRWTAVMRSKMNEERDSTWPYVIDMECSALLTVDESLDETSARRGVTITAHSVLYGAIRETVAWLTARQPFGPMLLGLSVLKLPQAPSGNAGDSK